MELLFVLIVLPLLLRFVIRRNREERYYRRMYWTVRKAQEDANQNKDKND